MKYKTHIYKSVAFKKNHKSNEIVEAVLRKEAEFSIPDLLSEDFPVVANLIDTAGETIVMQFRSDGKDLFKEYKSESIEPEVSQMFEAACCGEIEKDGSVKFFLDSTKSDWLSIRDENGKRIKTSTICDLRISDNGTSERYNRHFNDFVCLEGKYWQRISGVPCYEVSENSPDASVRVKYKPFVDAKRNVYNANKNIERTLEHSAIFSPNDYDAALAYALNHGASDISKNTTKIKVLNQDILERLWKNT